MRGKSAAVRAARGALRRSVDRSPLARKVARRAVGELTTALDQGVYGGDYFGEGYDPLKRMGLSGYERYARDTSNADVAAYMIWRYFNPKQSLDVGCALGFVVEALVELGVDAHGFEYSEWAVEHPAPGAAGRLKWANVCGTLPCKPRSFDVVTALETLEHLPPEDVPAAVRNLAQATRGYVVCTIPSFGPNDHGPHGFLEGKVPDEVLDHYRSQLPGYDGPVPYDDLLRDAGGVPIQGHLTIASYRWWTARFEEAGLVRCGAAEERIHLALARLGFSEFWNLYVLRRPEAPEPPVEPLPAAVRREVELRWGLDQRPLSERALQFLAEGLGPDAAAAARLEIPPRPTPAGVPRAEPGSG
jgi:hypothetical protein